MIEFLKGLDNTNPAVLALIDMYSRVKTVDEKRAAIEALVKIIEPSQQLELAVRASTQGISSGIIREIICKNWYIDQALIEVRKGYLEHLKAAPVYELKRFFRFYEQQLSVFQHGDLKVLHDLACGLYNRSHDKRYRIIAEFSGVYSGDIREVYALLSKLQDSYRLTEGCPECQGVVSYLIALCYQRVCLSRAAIPCLEARPALRTNYTVRCPVCNDDDDDENYFKLDTISKGWELEGMKKDTTPFDICYSPADEPPEELLDILQRGITRGFVFTIVNLFDHPHRFNLDFVAELK